MNQKQNYAGEKPFTSTVPMNRGLETTKTAQAFKCTGTNPGCPIQDHHFNEEVCMNQKQSWEENLKDLERKTERGMYWVRLDSVREIIKQAIQTREREIREEYKNKKHFVLPPAIPVELPERLITCCDITKQQLLERLIVGLERILVDLNTGYVKKPDLQTWIVLSSDKGFYLPTLTITTPSKEEIIERSRGAQTALGNVQERFIALIQEEKERL